MIFFQLCKVLLLSLFIKNNLYNDKLIKILLETIYKCGVIPIKMIQWGLPFMKTIELDANIIEVFENTYEKCPIHKLEYTNEIYHKDFYSSLNDDYEIIEIVGSGSIGQVYKIKDKHDKIYAMKVKHPNADNDFSTIRFYLKIIFTIFSFNKLIPISLDDFLDQFEEQLYFINESNNILKFGELYKNNKLYKIPQLFKFSENIIIMEYLKGKTINEFSHNNLKHSKFNLFIFIFMNNNLFINNLNHGDLHNYNWKITEDDKIVIFDFGLCWKLKNNKIIQYLHILVEGLYKKDYDIIYKSFYNLINTSSNIQNKLIREYFNKNMIGKINRFIDFFRHLIRFSIDNGIKLDVNLLYIMISWQNTLIIFMKRFKESDNFEHNNLYTEEYNICDYYDILPEYKKHLRKEIFKYKKITDIDYSKFNKFIT